MSIALDTYFIITPSTNFKSKAHSNFGGQELFFYISDTQELRVKVFGGLVSFTLAIAARWVEVVTATSVVHVWFSDMNGSIFYIPFQHLGAGNVIPLAIGINSISPFSVMYAPQATPPSFIMATDDGLSHHLYSATDPQFQSQNSQPIVIFTNLIDQTKYTSRPQVAMHPDDTDRVTVHVQQLDITHNTSKVGFYVVRVPGIA